MQSWALTVDKIIIHAARWHGSREVIAFRDDGVVERRTYAELCADAARLSNALLALGIGKGDRVATLAMNGAGHFLAWYAIAGIGAVCHTLNPKIGDEHLGWIIDHASDRILICDGAFCDLARRLAARSASIEQVIYLTVPKGDASEPSKLLDEVIAEQEPACVWGDFEEDSAVGLCYTSGTVGNPKGVLYSHRSNVLHSLMTTQSDMFDLSARDTVMPIVPMYHANAWGLVFSTPAVGGKLVLPGAQLDGETLYRRMIDEGVTFAAAVPTAWLGLLEYMEATGGRLPNLKHIIVGGAALPEHMLRRFDRIGARVTHAWGMTELSPVGGVATPVPETLAMTQEERVPYRMKQGRVYFGIDMRVVDEAGTELPLDGSANGALQMHGPTVAAGYFGLNTTATTPDHYLDTGDIATIDPYGYVKITDRAKDVIKSGGEWISSIEIENAACTFPGVVMAAALGIWHPKWDERPLLLIKVSEGVAVPEVALRDHLASKLPKWWLPDEIRIVAEIPLGPTGKIDKKALRTKITENKSTLSLQEKQ